jgi:pimeloyl-ACP methyl ester carboxylesterase
MLEIMHPPEESVRSGDGVCIGFTQIGQGPPLVFVHGSLGDGDDWRKVVSLLAGRFTCYVMDRRGRGRSSDAAEYSIDREYEDVAAVIQHAGPETSVIAHSFGAICALGAALRIAVASLVLYEPPIPVSGPVAGAALEEYRAAVDRGALDEALEIGLKRFSRMPDQEIARIRQVRMWTKQRALSPTWVRELQAIDQHGPSLERYRAISAPALLLVGTDSTGLRGASEALVRVLPAARLELLEGQGHVAHFRAPEEFAEKIMAFLTAQSLQ